MGLDQVFELFTQRLRIAAGLFVQDHQVGHEPMHAPIGMRLKHLADQAQIARLADGDQGDGQVARDGISPQAGLALAVFGDALRGGAQQGIGIEQMAGQLLEAARIVGLDAQQAQLKLGRGPGEIHRPVDRMGIAVLVHQAGGLFARGAGGQNQGNLDPLAGSQSEALAQAEDRIQDKSLAVAGFLQQRPSGWRACGRGR